MFGRSAHALERLHPERIGEIARLHFNAVQLADALRASIQAGVASEAIGAPAEASEHYGRALDIWDRVDDPVGCGGVSPARPDAERARAADLARDFDLAVELGRRAAAEAAGTAAEGSVLNDLAGYLWNSGAPGMEEVIEPAGTPLRRLPRLGDVDAVAGDAVASELEHRDAEHPGAAVVADRQLADPHVL